MKRHLALLGFFSCALLATNVAAGGGRAPVVYSNSLVADPYQITRVEGGCYGGDATDRQTLLGMGNYGWNCQSVNNYALADDFIVPANETWTIEEVVLYLYEVDYEVDVTGTPSITSCDVLLTTTNPLGGTCPALTSYTPAVTMTNVWKVDDTDAPGTVCVREIQQCVITLAPPYVAAAGQHFLIWQAAGTGSHGPWHPPVVELGATQKTLGPADAMQAAPGRNFAYIIDPGTAATQQDLVFELRGGAPPPAPDLTVLPGEFSLPAYAVEGHPYRIEATVRNVGSEPAADTFDVWFLQAPPSDPENWTRIEELTIYGLDAGESVVLGTPFVPDEAGLWHLQVIVDPDDVIDESDEDNNEVTDIAAVYPVIGILASCQYHVDSETLDIDAVVHNFSSGEDMTTGLVTWDLYDSGGAPVPGHGGTEDPFTYNYGTARWENHGNPTDGGDLTMGEAYTVRVRYMLNYPAYVDFLKASGIASLTCHVQDGYDDPLNNAHVELWHPLREWLLHHDATYEGYTGAEGSVFFEQLPAGIHVARISHGDFFPKIRIFILLSDQDHVRNITLGATAEEIFAALLDPLRDACEDAMYSMASDLVDINHEYIDIGTLNAEDVFWMVADVAGDVLFGIAVDNVAYQGARAYLNFSVNSWDDFVRVVGTAASARLIRELQEESVKLAMGLLKDGLIRQTVELVDIIDPDSPTGEFYGILQDQIALTYDEFIAAVPPDGPNPELDLERATGVAEFIADQVQDCGSEDTLTIPFKYDEPRSLYFAASKREFDSACAAYEVAGAASKAHIAAKWILRGAAVIAAPFTACASLAALPVIEGIDQVMGPVTAAAECAMHGAVMAAFAISMDNWFNDMRTVPSVFSDAKDFFLDEETEPRYLRQGAECEVWIKKFVFTADWEFLGKKIVFAPWDGGVANHPVEIEVLNPEINDGPVSVFAYVNNRDWRSELDLPVGGRWSVDNGAFEWFVEAYDFWRTFVPRAFRVEVYGGVPVTVSQWREVEYYVLPELFRKRSPTPDTLVPFSTGRGQLRLRDIEGLLPTEYLVFEDDLGEVNPVLESEFTVSSDVSSVEFHLAYPPGSVIEFSVEDETHRRIGQNFATGLADRQFPGEFSGRMRNPQIIRIPNAAKQTYTVRAELAKQFWAGQEHHVVAKAFEVPNRPAVLTVQPNQVEALGTPGSEVEVFVLVGEAGLAQALLDVTAEIGPIEFEAVVLTNVTPALVEIGPVLPESGTQASFVLGVPEEAPAGDYTGEIIVSSSNAGSLTVPVSVDVSNPPTKPALPTGPVLGFVDESYEYTTFATEPEGKEIYYRLYWGDGPGTDWLGPYASGEPCSASHTWAEPSVYQVKAIAKDASGHYSEWSDALLVCIGSEDSDGDGIPDECECPGDLDADADTDQADLGILLADWGCDDPVNGCAGDLNGDDKTDQADLGILLADWGCGT